MSVQATFAATLVDEWARAGLNRAVICPGSRSTPMALALSGDDRFVVHVILDERSAGFFALGLALASGNPAVILTTSGTAAFELHAAVVEAHQARVPMLIVTADRPAELHDVGAPQTAKQSNIYGSELRWSANPGPAREGAGRFWRSLASRAVAEATVGPSGPGPVHLNLVFEEPLEAPPDDLPPGRPGQSVWHQARPGILEPPVGLAAELVDNRDRRGLIVAGAGAGDPAAIAAMSKMMGWPVIADARSGLRGRVPVVAGADSLVRHRKWADEHQAEFVLHLGQAWASRPLNTWLAQSPARHVVIDPHWGWIDPDRVAHLVVRADPNALALGVAALDPSPPAASEWNSSWLQAETLAQTGIDAVLARHHQVSEPGVARALTAGLAVPANLVVASSMPIRDVESFGWSGPMGRPASVLANRGVNGIDGMISTVLGVTSAGRGPAVGLLGDLAFLHDAGALAGLSEVTASGGPGPVLVVIDNRGGGIFSFLAQAQAMERSKFERLLATPPHADILAVASGYGLAGTEIKDMSELMPKVNELLSSGRPGLVLCRTERDTNVEMHQELHEGVAAALG